MVFIQGIVSFSHFTTFVRSRTFEFLTIGSFGERDWFGRCAFFGAAGHVRAPLGDFGCSWGPPGLFLDAPGAPLAAP